MGFPLWFIIKHKTWSMVMWMEGNITNAKQTNEQTKNKERGMQMEFEYDVSGSVGLLL